MLAHVISFQSSSVYYIYGSIKKTNNLQEKELTLVNILYNICNNTHVAKQSHGLIMGNIIL